MTSMSIHSPCYKKYTPPAVDMTTVQAVAKCVPDTEPSGEQKQLIAEAPRCEGQRTHFFVQVLCHYHMTV